MPEKTAIKEKQPFIFYVLLCLVFINYIKIQYFFSPLGALHLPMLLGLVLIAHTANQCLTHRNNIFPLDKISKLQIGFFIAMCLSTLFAYRQFTSYTTLMDQLKIFLLFFFIINLVDSKAKLIKFVWTWILSILVAALVGFSYFLNGQNIDNLEVGGSLSGGDDFAAALNFVLPFAFFIFFMEKGWKKVFALFIFCFFSVLVILVGSRGGFLGLAAVFFIILIKSPSKLFAGSLAAIGLLTLLTLAPPQFFSEFKSITDTQESTANHRLTMWKDGLDIFADNPVFGIGLMNFPSYYGHFYMPFRRSVFGQARWKVAHSDPVTVLCELGSLGTIIYLLIIYNVLKVNFLFQKQSKTSSGDGDPTFGYLANGIFTGFMGYLVCSVFLTLIYYPHFYIFAALTSVLWRIHFKSTAPDIISHETGSLSISNP